MVREIMARKIMAGVLSIGKAVVALVAAGGVMLAIGWFGDFLTVKPALPKNSYMIAPVEVAKPGAAQPAQANAEGKTSPVTAPKAGAADTPVTPLLASASVAEGEALTKPCKVCHSFTKGGAAKIGPNLYGVVGGPRAHMEGFAYSASMKAMNNQRWDYEDLSKFLTAPSAFVPKTKMAFAGLKKIEQRANVIAYLRSLSDNPVPLPAK